MQILVTFALDAEFAPWRRRRSFRRVTSPGGRAGSVHEAVIAGATIRAVLTGVGAARARALRSWIEEERPDICLASGLAGALTPGTTRGAVVVAREVLAPDGAARYAGDRDLVAHAEACGARPIDALTGADRILVTSAEKMTLARTADAVDMESYAIVGMAAALGVPAAAVRAISDGADEDLPLDFNRTLGTDGRVSLWRVAGQVARHPGRVGRLLAFGRGSAAAAAALGGFLDEYVGRLAARGAGAREALAG